ncbi:MAG: hypothetical protein AAGF28_03885 [Pseudomonadota bacterium]
MVELARTLRDLSSTLHTLSLEAQLTNAADKIRNNIETRALAGSEDVRTSLEDEGGRSAIISVELDMRHHERDEEFENLLTGLPTEGQKR